MAYSISWSGAKTEIHVFKMAVIFRDQKHRSPQCGQKTEHLPSSRPPLFSLPTTFNILFMKLHGLTSPARLGATSYDIVD
jgi:hypothetical protein